MYAPPGSIGVTFEATRDGHVVCDVADGSPLEEELFVGDVMVAFNGVDVKRKSASDLEVDGCARPPCGWLRAHSLPS